MISGDVLKYLNGFFILGRYEAALADSRQFPLTMPAQQLSADINAAQTVTINLGWLKGRTVGGFIEHDEDVQVPD